MRWVYALVQLLNPKIGYMGNEKSFLALDAPRDIYALTIHNIKLSRYRQEKGCQFSAYHVPEFHIVTKVLVRNHTRDVWDPKYNVAYHVVCVMGWQMELVDKSDKICRVNVKDLQIICLVDELIKCLPHEKAFGYASKYHTHPKLIEDLQSPLNQKTLPDAKDHQVGIVLLNTWKWLNHSKCLFHLPYHILHVLKQTNYNLHLIPF